MVDSRRIATKYRTIIFATQQEDEEQDVFVLHLRRLREKLKDTREFVVLTVCAQSVSLCKCSRGEIVCGQGKCQRQSSSSSSEQRIRITWCE